MSEVRQKAGGNGTEALRRKEWTRPELKIMSAGSAELAVGVADDGADES